ncbi:cadherin domain-containing protein, partial [Caenimonas soli]|uniref:cadherin domain-containing protein n=1 Tax=Caenimonas soli TaxID=2735555 RepID=UPI001554C8BB
MKKNRTSGIQRRKPQLMALEPRLMFDGAAVAAAEAAALPGDGSGHATEAPALPPVEAAPAVAPAVDAPAVNRHEIVFVDTSITGWEALVADTHPGVEVVLLDPARDPFAQMAQRLEGTRDLDAIHVLSHGSDGALIIGGHAYDASTLDQHRAELATVGRALTSGGDILLYGCDIANGGSGAAFVGEIARLTQSDVAASTDTTGAANPWGGDWTLEATSGDVEASLFASPDSLADYSGKLSTVNLSGNTGWTAIMFGSAQDPHGDSQAGAADTDIIADLTHGSLYTAYDDGGTTTTADDYLVFRLRVDNPTSPTEFGGVAVIGMDADLDGRIDLFMTVDGRNNGQVVRLMDPGTGANISPSTTTTTPLPAGWLPNNGVYPMAASNYSVVAVGATTDPHWNGDTDLGNDGVGDAFVNFRIPIADLATVLAKPSPVGRDGTYGPRGATGISGFDKDTVVQYVSFTQTQSGPINGDLNGVGKNYDSNATFASLGAMTAPMSPSNPVSAGPAITVSEPISGGMLNDAEDNSVAISGTSTYLANRLLTLTVNDGISTVTGTTTTAGNGTWTVSGLDLSALNNGTLTVSATATDDAGNAILDLGSVSHDKTAPVVTIDQLATGTSGQPTISGTSDQPDGSMLTVTIDHDNNALTANLVYQVVVSGGLWTLNTGTVSPVSGTMPSSGLTSSAKITASATDAAGNSASTIALTRPTVNTVSSNLAAPIVSGTWTNIGGDTLTVSVSGATYTLSPSGNTWTLDLATATPASGTFTPLVPGNSYEVVATVTRASTSVSDTTSAEVTATNDPVVAIDITGGATDSGLDTTPVVTGTSSNAGGFVIVRLDPGDDGDLADAVTYSVTPGAGGSWSLDVGSASPISGSLPSGGLVGAIGITATDSTGAVSDTQVLTITTPTVSIGGITSAASTNTFAQVSNSGGGAAYLNMTEDDSVTISGTATSGFTVDIVVRDSNGNSVTASNVAVTGGNWSASGLNLSSLDNSTLTVTATLSGTSISATDSSVTHDKTALSIINTTQSPIRATSGATIKGVTDLPANTTLTVQIYTASDYSGSPVQTLSPVVQADGSWSAATTSNLSNNTTYYFRVSAPANTVDAAGNLVQKVDFSRQAQNSIGNSARSIDMKSVSGDNLVTVGDITSGLVLQGETNQTSSTVTVVVSQGGTTLYTKTATSGATYTAGTNNWSVTLTAAEVQAMANGQFQVSATVLDTGISLTDVELPTLDLDTPVLTITDDTAGTIATGPVTFTFTFTEALKAGTFTASDITVTNGTKGAFSGSGTTYTLVVTPTASASGTITATVAAGAATGDLTGRGNAAATTTQAFNTTTAAAAPTVTVDTSALATDSTPSITGTSSLAAGSPIVVEIDTDNDGDTDVAYSATMQSNGTWSVDLGSATPTLGALPAAGLDPSAKVTATATNAFGGSSSATGLNKPTVVSQLSSDNTPTVTGTWTQTGSDTLSVVVNGVTYSAANGNLTVTATGWSLTPASAMADASYSVNATVTRGASSVVDPTSSEIVIDTLATVTIGGGATTETTGDSTPVISGSSTGLPAGTVLTLSLDTDNNGASDLVYKTVVAADGSWSVNTATAVAFSGSFPATGLTGPAPITATATDPAGNTGTDVQTLTVDVTPPVIAITSNARTPDTTPVLGGTTDLAVGSTVTVVVDPDITSGATTHTYTAIVRAGGIWDVDTGNPTANGGTGPSVTYTSGNTLGVTASGADAVGNATSTTRNVEIGAAPTVAVTEPLDGAGGNGTLTAAEDDSVVIQGTATSVPDGSVVYVSITDGSTTISDTAVVTGGVWTLLPLNLSGMANGVLSVSATYVDGSGDSYGDTGTVLHDKSGVVSIDQISNDTGTVSDFITSDKTLSFSGTAAANATVTLTLTDSSAGTVFNISVVANSTGTWTYDFTGTTLSDGGYTLLAASGGSATQAIVIDSTAPLGPVTVTSQTTVDTTPTITGTATLGTGESLSVTVNGVTYTPGDGNLVHVGAAWTLTIPAADALQTAVGGAFNGVYNVSATVRDSAGNVLSDSTSGELTVRDTTAPVLDLDPSDGGTINRSVTSLNGAAVSLDDDADAATLVELSDKLGAVTVTVAGLANGTNERLVFGSTDLAANGSNGDQADVLVGGVRVNVSHAGGVFTIQRFDGANLTAAEARAIIGDVTYQNTAATPTGGNRTFTVVATDEAGNNSAAATTTVTVSVDTTAPSITGPSGATGATSAKSIDENGTAVHTFTANEAVTWSLAAGEDQGKFSINASTGALTFAAAPNYEGPTDGATTGSNTYIVQVRATDGAGNASIQTVTVTINNVDEVAPTITSGTTATAINENSGANQLVYTATATDAGDISAGITYSLGGADAAAFTINASGQVSLTGDPDHETKSSYSFTVVADDGVTTPAQQAVTLAINDLDEADPSITSGATATAIDENSGAGPVIYTATATDTDDISAGVTFSLAGTDAAAFTINAGTGAVTLTGNANHEVKSSYSFSVVATDGVGRTDTQVVTLAINDLDEADPTVTSGATATAIDENSGAGQVVYTATATDADDISTGVTFSLAGTDAAAFTINASTGAVTLTGNPNHEAKSSYSFTVVATDGVGRSDSQAVSLAVNDLDEADPTITSGATATAIDENSGAGQVVYTASATDTGDISAGVTFSLAGTDAAAFTINASTGAVTLTGNPDHEAKSSYSFSVVATDGVGRTDTQAVTLAINDLDEADPTITSGAAATAIDENSGAGQVIYTASATDTDDISAGVTFSLAGTDAVAFTINAGTGAVTLTGNPNHEAKSSYSFSVVATDGVGRTDSQAVTLAINDLDEADPTITSGGTATAIDENSGAGQVVYTASATDTDDVSDGLTFSLAGTDAAAFTINASTGAVTLTGNPNHEAKSDYSFTVVATDGGGRTDSQAVTLAINDLDEADPTITSGATATAIDENSGAGQVIYTVTATDTDDVSAGVTFSLAGTDAAAFTINAGNGAVTLTGNPNYEGKSSYSFSVVATDGVGRTDSQAVTLAISNVIDLDDDTTAPQITGPSGATGATSAKSVDENGTAVHTFTANESVTWSVVGGQDQAKFSIDAATGALSFQAAPDYESPTDGATSGANTYIVQLRAADASGNSSTQTVTVSINNVDEADPTITSGATATAIDENSGTGQVVYTATATDTDDVSAGVTFSLSGTDAAAFTINAGTGAVTLTGNPDHETKSSYSFSVVATDGVGRTDTQAVTLAINDLDEADPSITSGTTATTIDENSGGGQVIYTAIATDTDDISAGVTFSLAGTDAAAFNINASTGAVTLTGNPNHETKSSYSFSVVATDGVGRTDSQAVTLAINDLDEADPTITSAAAATAIDENSGAGQVIYTATATDTDDISTGVTFSLAGTDAAAFTISASTGAVTLTGNPNHETKSSYSFGVVATDGVGRTDSQAVTLAINDLDEADPTLTSGATATAINENSGAGQVVYTATATDTDDVSAGLTFSLSGADAAAFTIDGATGVVTLTGNPNHESKSSYSFTVVAADGVGRTDSQVVTLVINDLDEADPTITSGATSTAIDENSGTGQVVYSATATDTDDISAGVTFSLAGTDAAAFSIDASTGAVTLTGNPNHEAKSSYSFTVVATDGVGRTDSQAVTLAINDLDEADPTVTSGATATAIDENSGA